MRRFLRNVFTYATCDHRGRCLTADEILHADPIPKVLLMPAIWRGDLKPLLEAYLEQLRPMENGRTSGGTLSAEAVPATLDLGSRWLGNFRDRLMAAARSDGALNAEPVLSALEAVRRQMQVGNPAAVADGLRRLRRAADNVNSALFGSHCDDPRRDTGLMRHRIGDFSQPASIAAINARNANYWKQRAVNPSVDSRGRMSWRTGDNAARTASTAFRDAMHAASHAATPRDLIRARNAAAKAFWSSGEPPTVTGDMLRLAPAPAAASTPAEINAFNRAHWASR